MNMTHIEQAQPQITRVDIFGTATGSLNSRVCAHITGGPQTHTGFIFRTEDGQDVYMEAMFRMGIVPPRSVEKLETFLLKDIGKNRLWIAETGIEGAKAHAMFESCQKDVGEYGYYEWQLVLMWFNERIGRFIRWTIPHSEKLVVCSEWVAEHMENDAGYHLTDPQHRNVDSVTPASAFRRMTEIASWMGWWRKPYEVMPGDKI